jgi:Kef-type K+ transport system membrane component KefB
MEHGFDLTAMAIVAADAALFGFVLLRLRQPALVGFILAAIAFCLSVAAVSSLLGLSPAFGAFLAGLVLGASTVRRQVLRGSLPL